jgi:hypothetical protein
MRYANTARRKKRPQSTSRRSVTQATDSARSGWTPKTSAAKLALHSSGKPLEKTAGDEKPASHEIEDDGVHRVNEHVAQVVAPWVHSTEGVVEAERHPGERDVVPHQGPRPHPTELRPAQPTKTVIVEEVDVVNPS